MTVYRKPTKDEQLKGWADLAFEMNLHRTITMNQGAVVRCLERIDSWVQAHSDQNGERDDKRIQQNIAAAFWTRIARDATPGIKSK
jgi:hypothetical protein